MREKRTNMVLRYHRRHGAKAAINVKYSEACKTLEIEEQTAPKAQRPPIAVWCSNIIPTRAAMPKNLWQWYAPIKATLPAIRLHTPHKDIKPPPKKDKPRKRQGLLLARRKGRIGLNGYAG